MDALFYYDENTHTYSKAPNVKINIQEIIESGDNTMGVSAFLYASMLSGKEYSEEEFQGLYNKANTDYLLSKLVEEKLIQMSLDENGEVVYSILAAGEDVLKGYGHNV